MRRYWDASALIDAIHDARIEEMAAETDQWTRPHALAEVFSQLSGGRLPVKYLADDAAALISEIAKHFSFVELTAEETREALRKAHAHGVRGGRVHDWLHAVAAKNCEAEGLLTDNFADFTGLEDGFKLGAP